MITWVTLRATSLSAGVPPTKSGSAIGIGWMLPWVTSMLTTAPRGADRSASARRRPRRRSSVAARQQSPAMQVEASFERFQSCDGPELSGQPPNISRGSKVISMSFHCW